MYSVRVLSLSSGARPEKRHLPGEPNLQAARMSWRNNKEDFGSMYLKCCRCKVRFMSEAADITKSDLKSAMCIECKRKQKRDTQSRRVRFSEVIDIVYVNSDQRSTMCQRSSVAPEGGRCAALECKYRGRLVKCEICQRCFHDGCTELPKAGLRTFRCQDCRGPVVTVTRLPVSSFARQKQAERKKQVQEKWSITI